jgi:hypothetical protein
MYCTSCIVEKLNHMLVFYLFYLVCRWWDFIFLWNRHNYTCWCTYMSTWCEIPWSFFCFLPSFFEKEWDSIKNRGSPTSPMDIKWAPYPYRPLTRPPPQYINKHKIWETCFYFVPNKISCEWIYDMVQSP